MSKHQHSASFVGRLVRGTVMFALAGAGAYVLIRQQRARQPALAPAQRTGELQETVVAVLGETAPTTSLEAALAEAVAPSAASEPAAATPKSAASTATDAHAIIGNERTFIYHFPESIHLPVEENRRYFANEGEAQAAGFRRAEGE